MSGNRTISVELVRDLEDHFRRKGRLAAFRGSMVGPGHRLVIVEWTDDDIKVLESLPNGTTRAKAETLASVHRVMTPALVEGLRGWDDVKPTSECLHCSNGQDSPSSDGRTECGFCDG